MKRIIVLICFCFIACKKEFNNTNIKNNNNTLILNEESDKENFSKPVDDKIEGPISVFLKFTDSLNNLGWVADHDRMKKVHYGSVIGGELTIINNVPFYKCDVKNHILFFYKNQDNTVLDTFNFDLFKEQKSIWSYFYTEKFPNSNFISDGIIEQWKFSSNEKAKEARNELEKIYPLPFFNTKPYYSVVDKYLFIFCTRASAFSYDQKNIHKLFEAMIEKEFF